MRMLVLHHKGGREHDKLRRRRLLRRLVLLLLLLPFPLASPSPQLLLLSRFVVVMAPPPLAFPFVLVRLEPKLPRLHKDELSKGTHLRGILWRPLQFLGERVRRGESGRSFTPGEHSPWDAARARRLTKSDG